MPDYAAVRRDSLVRYLARHVSGEVRFDDTSRRLYSTDASHYQIQPLGVVIPKTADDLTATVQIAAELHVPITARGGGTSLTGQSIGPGIVIDCSKYLNRVGEVDLASRTVRVQPGVVLDHLNRAVAKHDLIFGPDVATANRATIGGMIGNNSAGARSVVYRQTVDHVRSLKTVLSDGTAVEFGPVSAKEFDRKCELRTREGDAYRTAADIARTHADEIDRRFPKIIRKVSGYDLTRLGNSLVPLIVGSEGTLAVVAEAELTLVPRPKCRGLLVPHFASMRSALDAVAACLELGPSAVELMDRMLIDLAREQRALKRTMAAVVGRPAALLMAEFSADSQAEVDDLVATLARKLAGIPGLTACVTATDPELRDPLWNLRSAAVPLLYGMTGDRKPVTFVEDCAVDPGRVPEFADRFREVLNRHGTDGAFYGHASVGCLHIRPVLNLHDPADVTKMRAIMADVSDLVLAFGGSLSGEHGDGLVRSEWNEKMFGPAISDAFRRVKRAFDPDNVLNPGKVVDGPAMEANFRLPPGTEVHEPPTVLDYSAQGGFFRSVELCNGAGVCRKTQAGAMCPSYRATRDETDTPRARANALRLALSSVLPPLSPRGRGAGGEGKAASQEEVASLAKRIPLTPNPSHPRGEGDRSKTDMAARWIKPVMDLCLSCKACKAECPSNVDVAKLKAEFLHAHYDTRTRPLGHHLVGNVHRLSPIAARFAGILNWAGRRPFLRGLMEGATGIDRRRTLPELHRDHFRRWFSRRTDVADSLRESARLGCTFPIDTDSASQSSEVTHGVCDPRRKRVVLLDDCFTTFQEPHIGRAAVAVLERMGYAVELAGVCCGRAMISKGFLTDARDVARRGIRRLAKAAADGVPVLGLEPSCVLTLADEWPELVPGPQAKAVAAAAELADAWVARQVGDSEVSLAVSPHPGKAVFHPHCHQRALVGAAGTAAALKLVPGLGVTVLDAGCCGMAGAFGYEKEHFDVSLRIANLQLAPALAAAPDAVVVATGTSCRHQIRDVTGRHAVHPMELLAGAASPS